MTELEEGEGRGVKADPEVLAPLTRGNDGPADHSALEGHVGDVGPGHDDLGVVRNGAAHDAPSHAVRL